MAAVFRRDHPEFRLRNVTLMAPPPSAKKLGVSQQTSLLFHRNQGLGRLLAGFSPYSQLRFYSRTETQLVDPVIEADWGVGQTPATGNARTHNNNLTAQHDVGNTKHRRPLQNDDPSVLAILFRPIPE